MATHQAHRVEAWNCSAGQVEYRLLPIWAKIGTRMRLSYRECRDLARLFLLRNVDHWGCRMDPHRDEGCSSAGDCPGGVDAHEPTAVEGPTHVVDRHRPSYCRGCFDDHPWSLQASLLWNSRNGRPFPSRGCTWNVYRCIVENDKVRRRWHAVAGLRRPDGVAQPWRDFAIAMGNAYDGAVIADKPGGFETEDIAGRMREDILDEIVYLTNETVHEWACKRRKINRATLRQMRRWVGRLAHEMNVCRAMGTPFRPDRTVKVEYAVDKVLSLLKKLRVPSRQAIGLLLKQPQVPPNHQQVIRDCLNELVTAIQNTGFAQDDNPFKDDVYQDIFWHRVDRVNLAAWCRKHHGRSTGN